MVELQSYIQKSFILKAAKKKRVTTHKSIVIQLIAGFSRADMKPTTTEQYLP